MWKKSGFDRGTFLACLFFRPPPSYGRMAHHLHEILLGPGTLYPGSRRRFPLSRSRTSRPTSYVDVDVGRCARRSTLASPADSNRPPPIVLHEVKQAKGRLEVSSRSKTLEIGAHGRCASRTASRGRPLFPQAARRQLRSISTATTVTIKDLRGKSGTASPRLRHRGARGLSRPI